MEKNYAIQVVNFLFVYFCSQVLYVNAPLAANEIPLRCTGDPVTFVFGEKEETRGLCSTIIATIDFLKSIGIETTQDITIRLVDKIQDVKENELFGAYNAKTREVSVLTYANFLQEGKKALGITPTEEVWRSFAAHELAHAINEPLLSQYGTDHTREEYIAVVTQLTVLTPETREKVLMTFSDVKPYKSIDEMSSLYYLMDPDRFSVKCYLHFISLKNPIEFIEMISQARN